MGVLWLWSWLWLCLGWYGCFDFSAVRLYKFFDYGNRYVAPNWVVPILVLPPNVRRSERLRVFIPNVADLDGVISSPMSVISLSRVAVSILAGLDTERHAVCAMHSWSDTCLFVVVVHFDCGCIFPNSLMSLNSFSAL